MDYERHYKYIKQNNEQEYSNKSLDNHTLDIICKFVLSDNSMIKRCHLVNLNNLINIINPKTYNNDPEKDKRVSFIKKGLEGRLNFNLSDPYKILMYIYGTLTDNGIVNIDEFKGLSNDDVKWLNSMVSDTLKYYHIENSLDSMIDSINKIKSANASESKKDLIDDFQKCMNNIQNNIRRCKDQSITDAMFSLRNEYYENIMYDTYNELNSPARKLVTGMQGMNELVGGGFESGRCYVYFGLPGEGKSTVILNLLYQIKKYNKNYKTKDPTKIPCAVLLTMENTITESIERLFTMATGKQNMTNYSPENAMKMLKEEGELRLGDDSPIDIVIKFMPSNSVDTSFILEFYDDLMDQGLEPIIFFQDYIGRIRSTQKYQDTRLEYGAVVDEFKNFAEEKQIPFITAAQLNREASKHIDEGRKSSKSDLVRLIGRSNISESMLILNNIDGGFLIAPEITTDGTRYLGVQRIKIRYKAGDAEFVYLPFEQNSIKLVEDFNGIPSYKYSLRNDITSPASFSQYSQYQTNKIVNMDDFVMNSDNEDNIFSNANVISI